MRIKRVLAVKAYRLYSELCQSGVEKNIAFRVATSRLLSYYHLNNLMESPK